MTPRFRYRVPLTVIHEGSETAAKRADAVFANDGLAAINHALASVFAEAADEGTHVTGLFVGSPEMLEKRD